MPMVEINGTRIRYQAAGSGLPIVFIHPPLLSGNCFAYLREQLADRFQVITFDIRGHGASACSKQKLTYPLIAEDIQNLLDALHLPKAYLCGYSTGGSIALEALLAYPDRFLGGILISAMSEVSDWYNRSRIWAGIYLSRLQGKRLLTAAISAGNADMLQTFKNLYSHAMQGNIRNIYEYYEYSLYYNCTKRLQDVRSPILLIYGQKDKSFHRYARILQRNLPQSTLHFIPKAKHQLPTKNAGELQGIIRLWFDGIEAASEREEPFADEEFTKAAMPEWTVPESEQAQQ